MQSKANNRYFDLKVYFENEIKRLNAQDQKVNKTVNDNGKVETKSIRDTLWADELSVFENSNINKPAWSKSYNVLKTDSSEVYTAVDTLLKTRKISILRFPNGSIRNISIVNKTENELYDLEEKLEYAPNNFYSIERKQKATLMQERYFKVEGRFIN